MRRLPFETADGATNMAADEALLLSGRPTLRLYAWSEATVSLGYFQPSAARLPGLPWVRRPSGGHMLVHHHEVTYALVAPSADGWVARMHAVLAEALAAFGITAAPHRATTDEHFDGSLCFHHVTDGDLVVNGAKVVGSAQRKTHGLLLQHGGILLAQSPHTPTLPGLRELTGRTVAVPELCDAVIQSFVRQTGTSLEEATWTVDERKATARLREARYASPAWNEKR